MDLRLRRTLITGSATFGVWDRQYFLNVTDYDTWEEELLDDEDIVRHITAGHFVPITIYSDGAFEFEVRVGEPEINSLSPREHQFLIESSEPYLFRSAGELSVSGIEFVGEERDDQIATLQIPAGIMMSLCIISTGRKNPERKMNKGRRLQMHYRTLLCW